MFCSLSIQCDYHYVVNVKAFRALHLMFRGLRFPGLCLCSAFSRCALSRHPREIKHLQQDRRQQWKLLPGLMICNVLILFDNMNNFDSGLKNYEFLPFNSYFLPIY